MFYAEAELDAGARLTVRPARTRSAPSTSSQGAVEIDGEAHSRPGRLLVLRARASRELRHAAARRGHGCCCSAASRWTGRGTSGGTSSPRSAERIEQAKADWKAGRFGKVPGDAEEFIPLPADNEVASYP